MLIKTFESHVPKPTAHLVNEDVIILLFDECDKALIQTIKLNLSRGRISSVDSLLINDIHIPVLLKERTNFGIAFTHIVQNKNEDYHIPDDEFAAYYHVR